MSARRAGRPLGLVLAAAVSVTAGGMADADAPDRGSIVVTLGDGTTVPLRNWSLSYEYALYRQGTSPMSAPAARTEAADLFVGKRTLPTAGQTLSIAYEGTRPKDMTLAGSDGRKSTLKIEPPAREMLVASPEKGTAVMPRSLDVTGETVTGTHRDFCVLSYTAVVECGAAPADRVVKIEFQR
jgi:hypothetical protein